MKTPLWFSIGVFSLFPLLSTRGIAVLADFGDRVTAYHFAIFAKYYVAIIFVKAQLPYCVSEGRGKSRNAIFVLGDNSLPDSWLASCVVYDNNLAISKLFQLVYDNRVFLVLLYVITSFHKRCRASPVQVALQLPKSKRFCCTP